VIGDQGELFGPAASVPMVWRMLSEVAAGGSKTGGRVTAAVNAARRKAWAAGTARHGSLPGVAMADRVLEGVTCIRLDASVVPCHSQGRRRAEFQGRPSPAAGILRSHPGGTVLDDAAGQRRVEHHRRSPEGLGRGDCAGVPRWGDAVWHGH